MSQGFTYAVDIVLVIDATGSMSSIIDRVKAGAVGFEEELGKVMAKKGKHIDDLRIRVVAFRDFYDDDTDALECSDFIGLPEGRADLERFVSGITATGGGDAPETGLEALAEAMRSPWTRSGTRRRHVVVVWTDAGTHPLESKAGAKPGRYPAEMPADFDALTDMWEGQNFMDANAKRLVLFAPDAAAWSDIAAHWDSCVHYPSRSGDGLSEIHYNTILETIANSI